ncbi:MAG: hypothetical protein ABI142_03005 [Bryocella sp.]
MRQTRGSGLAEGRRKSRSLAQGRKLSFSVAVAIIFLADPFVVRRVDHAPVPT